MKSQLRSKKKTILIAAITLCLALIPVLALSIVWAALSATASNEFTISYKAQNVDALVEASYKTSTTAEQFIGSLEFSKSDASQTKSFDKVDPIILAGQDDYLEFHYTFQNRATTGFGVILTLSGFNAQNCQVYYTASYRSSDTTAAKYDFSAQSTDPTIKFVKASGTDSILDVGVQIKIIDGSVDLSTNGKFSFDLDGSASENIHISFDTSNSTNAESFAEGKDVEYGASIEEWDEIPVQTDKMFLYWCSDNGQEMTFPHRFTKDATLHAKFMDGNLPASFYKYDSASESYVITKGSGLTASTAVIPDVHNGTNGVKPVTKIEGVASVSTSLFPNAPFYSITTLNNLYIGNNVTSMGIAAVNNNKSLTYAFMGRNLTEIGAAAFAFDGLTDIRLPRKLTEIGQYMFYQNAFTNTDFLTDQITKIGASGFYQCQSLTSANLKNVQTVDSNAFVGSGVKTVVAPKLKTLVRTCFNNCSTLTDVDAPELETVGYGCFNQCSNLKNINYPSVKYIGMAAFQYCTNLEAYLPEGCLWIGDCAFGHCSASKQSAFIIPSTLVQVGGDEYVGDNEDNNILGSHVFYNFCTSTLQSFHVAPGSKHFVSVGGALYTKTKKYLVQYPPARKDSSFEIASGCEDVFELSIGRAPLLKRIVIPASFVIHSNLPSNFLNSQEGEGNFTNLVIACYAYSAVEEFALTADNTNYSVIDGLVYSADGTQLLAIPNHKALNGKLTFANSCKEVNVIACYYEATNTPSEIEIGANITKLAENFVKYLNSEVEGKFSWTLTSKSSAYTVTNNKLVKA